MEDFLGTSLLVLLKSSVFYKMKKKKGEQNMAIQALLLTEENFKMKRIRFSSEKFKIVIKEKNQIIKKKFPDEKWEKNPALEYAERRSEISGHIVLANTAKNWFRGNFRDLDDFLSLCNHLELDPCDFFDSDYTAFIGRFEKIKTNIKEIKPIDNPDLIGEMKDDLSFLKNKEDDFKILNIDYQQVYDVLKKIIEESEVLIAEKDAEQKQQHEKEKEQMLALINDYENELYFSEMRELEEKKKEIEAKQRKKEAEEIWEMNRISKIIDQGILGINQQYHLLYTSNFVSMLLSFTFWKDNIIFGVIGMLLLTMHIFFIKYLMNREWDGFSEAYLNRFEEIDHEFIRISWFIPLCFLGFWCLIEFVLGIENCDFVKITCFVGAEVFSFINTYKFIIKNRE